MSEACRQSSGLPPIGIYIPLAALAQSRDLTATGYGQLSKANLGNTLQPALGVDSAVMGGATLLSGLSGSSLVLPAIGASIDASGTWVSEGNVGLQKEPTFKQVVLTPKSLIFTLTVSRRLMANASVDLESELRSEILRQAMREIDRAALNGSGPETPTGLLNDGSLQILSAGVNGAAPTWAHLVEAEFQVGARTTGMRAPTFITSPAVRKKLRGTQRAAGLDFILDDDATRLMGHNLQTSPLVPDTLTKGTSAGVCSALVFGDLAEVFVGFWGPLAIDILVDGVTQAKNGQIRLIARCEVGVAVRNIGAFTAYKDILSA